MMVKSINGKSNLPTYYIPGSGNNNGSISTAYEMYTGIVNATYSCSNPSVSCSAVQGIAVPRLNSPQGISLNGLVTKPSSSFPNKIDYYVSSANRPLAFTLFENGDKLGDTAIEVSTFGVDYGNPSLTGGGSNPKGSGIPYDGMISLSYDYGIDMIISMPFFYAADMAFWTSNVTPVISTSTGTQINQTNIKNFRNNYAALVRIDPATGIAFEGHIRYQINLAIPFIDPAHPTTGVMGPVFPNIKSGILYPQAWVDSGNSMSEDSATLFLGLVKLTGYFLPIMAALLVIGVLLLLVGLCCCCKRSKVASV